MNKSVSSLIVASMVAGGCAGGDLPGHRFDVAVEVSEDGCAQDTVGDKESFTYRVVVEGASAQVFVGEDLLGTGVLSGCDITYTSPLWSDVRPRGDIRWRLSGDAVIALGDGCAAEDGWTGIETAEILESADADVQGGCVVRWDVTGSYEGEVE